MILDMVKTAIQALDSKKAVDIKAIDVSELTTLADYMIICNGSSTTQIKSLADECEYQMEQSGYTVLHREGKSAGNWILLDYKDIIVHIYNKEMREFYDMEKVWSDGKQIDIKEYIEE